MGLLKLRLITSSLKLTDEQNQTAEPTNIATADQIRDPEDDHDDFAQGEREDRKGLSTTTQLPSREVKVYETSPSLELTDGQNQTAEPTNIAASGQGRASDVVYEKPTETQELKNGQRRIKKYRTS